MDRSQKKIHAGVFRDLLIGTRKSIRSITAPDTIYKNNEEDDHLNPDFEFLSLDERMALLLETNPFLQDIKLLSYTSINQK